MRFIYIVLSHLLEPRMSIYIKDPQFISCMANSKSFGVYQQLKKLDRGNPPYPTDITEHRLYSADVFSIRG